MEKNNLEGIKFGAVINNNGISYKEFRKHLKPNFTKVWIDITTGYLLLTATLYSYWWLEQNVSSVALLIVLGLIFSSLAAFWIAYLQLFLHEASHYNIHPNKKTNDTLSNIFLGLMVGVNIKAYRKTHWKHHLRLGHTDDTEHSYFTALTWGYLFKMLTGLHVLSVLSSRQKIENAQNEQSLKQQKLALVTGALLNLIIVTLLVFYGNYFTALVWVIALGVFYPFFATIRQILEHRDEHSDPKTNFFKTDHGKVSRLFKDGLFSNFFGGAGFNRHLIHHWDPQISYTRLKEVEQFLEQTEVCGKQIKDSKTTYYKTLQKLIR